MNSLNIRGGEVQLYSIGKFPFFYNSAPVYDSQGNWQATGSDLQSSAVQAHVDSSSFSTQHYAFLSGTDGGGAIGIAYLGTPCFRNSNGMWLAKSYKCCFSYPILKTVDLYKNL